MGLGIQITAGGMPDAELANAALVEVFQALDQPTRYSLYLPIDIEDGDFPWLVDGRLGPGGEISVDVPQEFGMATLAKGPVRGQRVEWKHGGEGSRLVVEGSDILVKLDRETKVRVWSEVTDSEAVTQLATAHGLVPDIESTNARHTSMKNTLVQRETDLFFLRRLARRNGFSFWVSSEMGVDTLHWKRMNLDAEPQAEIILNLESPNVQSFDLEWDGERPKQAFHYQVEAQGKSVLDGSVSMTPQAPLGATPFASVDAETRTVWLSHPADEAAALQASSEGALIEAEWFIQARCVTELNAFGQVIFPSALVTVRGLGSRHSGAYLVKAVTHSIDATAHRMELQLARNAWGA